MFPVGRRREIFESSLQRPPADEAAPLDEGSTEALTEVSGVSGMPEADQDQDEGADADQ